MTIFGELAIGEKFFYAGTLFTKISTTRGRAGNVTITFGFYNHVRKQN